MKLLLAGLVVTAASVTTMAMADPPDPTPGHLNQIMKDSCGTPGQNVLNMPANEFAQMRNRARKNGLAFGCAVIPPPVPGS